MSFLRRLFLPTEAEKIESKIKSALKDLVTTSDVISDKILIPRSLRLGGRYGEHGEIGLDADFLNTSLVKLEKAKEFCEKRIEYYKSHLDAKELSKDQFNSKYFQDLSILIDKYEHQFNKIQAKILSMFPKDKKSVRDIEVYRFIKGSIVEFIEELQKELSQQQIKIQQHERNLREVFDQSDDAILLDDRSDDAIDSPLLKFKGVEVQMEDEKGSYTPPELKR